MLRNTALSISEVGYALGFESQAYFSRVFKQVALKTPTEIPQIHRAFDGRARGPPSNHFRHPVHRARPAPRSCFDSITSVTGPERAE